MKINLILLLLFSCYLSINAHEPAVSNSFPFTENKGQWHENILFLSEQEGADVYFEKDRFHYQFTHTPSYHAGNKPINKEAKYHIFDAQFIGSNPYIQVLKGSTSKSYKNYFIGNDRTKWAPRVYNYDYFKYEELYNGIDLLVYTDQGRIKYDYHISAESSPCQIRVQYNGVDQPVVKDGNLVITHTMGELIEEKPFAYQLKGGAKVQVACNYVISEEGILYFEFPQGYDKSKELVIDPVLIFSTYSGSISDNWGMSATYDDDGNGFMGGLTFGNRYVTTLGALQTAFGGALVDIAIAKFSSDGTNLEYATYLGGNDNETVHSMVTDSAGNLYIFGVSSSGNFPTTTNAFDRLKESSNNIRTEIIDDNPSTTNVEDFGGGTDIIVVRLSRDGDSLMSSTFYGGNEADGINYNKSLSGAPQNLNYNYGDSHRGEIVLDSAGNCFIGTSTLSTNLPNIQGTNSGNQEGLIVKFNSDLSNVIWSRFVGGSGKDAIYSLKVIGDGKVIVGGGSTSPSISTAPPGSYQPVNAGGIADGFISIISASGTTIEKSTFMGTSSYDQVYFVEFDRFNNAYAYGQSLGGTFPILRSPISNAGAGQFIVKLDKNLDSLEFSLTFGNGLGNGRINISPTAFLVDRCQNIYASGWGGSLAGDGAKNLPTSMPLANNSGLPFTSTTDNGDFYLYVSNRMADSIIYASFFGGTSSNDHIDGGTSRFDKDGIIYQSVCASCGGNRSDFPTATINNSTSVHSSTNNSGNCNNALFKLDFEIVIRASFSLDNRDICLKSGTIDSVKVTNSSVDATNITWDFYGDTVVSAFTDTVVYFNTPGNYNIRQVVFDSICSIGDFLDLNILVRPDDIDLNLQFDSIVCYSDSTLITANTSGKADEFRYSRTSNFSSPLNSNVADSTLSVRLTPGMNIFYVKASDPSRNACEKLDTIQIFYSPTTANATISVNTVCEGTPIQFNANVTNANSFEWIFGNGTTDTNLNQQFLYGAPGNYAAFFIYENQLCLLKDSIPFNVQVVANDLQINSPLDTLFCGTGSFRVSVPSSGTITNYQYSSTRDFANTLNPSNSTNSFTINQSDSSLYYVKVSNDFCERIDSVLVQYVTYSLDLDAITDSACIPHFEPIQASVIGADSFQIIVSNGSIFRNDTTPLLVFNQEGNYNVKLLTSNQRCNRKDSIVRTISIFNAVDLQSIPDTLLCKGKSVILTSNGGGTATKFIWSLNPDLSFPFSSGNDSSIKVSPDVSTNYFIQGKNSFCFDLDTIQVEVEDLIIDVNDFESFCIYDTISLDAMVTFAASPLQYSWTPTDSIISGDNLISAVIAPQSNQFYYLYTQSFTGCEDFDTVEVEVNLPAFDDAFIIGADSLFKGEEAQLSTNRNGSNLSYEWEPASDLDNPNSPNPNTSLSTTTTYRVTITDLNTGCEVIAFRRLRVFEVNCGEPDIFIPTAFSPNGDLTNDVLYVRGANIREVEFQLFNRWGELVFETTEINKGWDGTYKGKEADPGVFVYQVRAICYDGQEFIDKGNITLLK